MAGKAIDKLAKTWLNFTAVITQNTNLKCLLKIMREISGSTFG
jgi:hypothetical protein